MRRIQSLDSVRGLLAIWIVIGHAIRQSGFELAELGPWKLLGSPGVGIDVFFTLSGFVIFHLLDNQRPSYREFIIRRFFRLTPIFFAVMLVSALAQPWRIDVLKKIPWENVALANEMTIHLDTMAYFTEHLLAHLTMLHGLFSSEILPSSDYAFVGQAWSISVEWQFYLIAPLFFWLITTRCWNWLGASALLLCTVFSLNYGGQGFIVGQMGYFLLGILSYYAGRGLESRTLDPRLIDAATFIGMALAYAFIPKALSVIIWCAVMGIVIASHRKETTVLQRTIFSILHHPWLLWLGRISYSVCMVHMLLIYVWSDLILSVAPNIDRIGFATALIPLSIASSIVTSWITFHLVERNGVRLVRARKMAVVSSPAAPIVAITNGATTREKSLT